MNVKKFDELLGREAPDPNTPLALATVADMAYEIGNRDAGAPAIVIYRERRGAWPCRLGPGTKAADLRRFSQILTDTAAIMQDCEDDPEFCDLGVVVPWGVVLRVRDRWLNRWSFVAKRRRSAIALWSYGLTCGLAIGWGAAWFLAWLAWH